MPPFSRPSHSHLELVADPWAGPFDLEDDAAQGWEAAPGWDTAPGWDAVPRPVDEAPTGEGWRSAALCAETDPEAFFPDKGGSTREAKRVCGGCPVLTQCLEYALGNDERFGIWGGLSERERRRIRLQRRTPLSA